jgi:hypothetical protein
VDDHGGGIGMIRALRALVVSAGWTRQTPPWVAAVFLARLTRLLRAGSKSAPRGATNRREPRRIENRDHDDGNGALASTLSPQASSSILLLPVHKNHTPAGMSFQG